MGYEPSGEGNRTEGNAIGESYLPLLDLNFHVL